nr:hypothetical protein Iba_chr03aCG7470 [Ipomoea batatas]
MEQWGRRKTSATTIRESSGEVEGQLRGCAQTRDASTTKSLTSGGEDVEEKGEEEKRRRLLAISQLRRSIAIMSSKAGQVSKGVMACVTQEVKDLYESTTFVEQNLQTWR